MIEGRRDRIYCPSTDSLKCQQQPRLGQAEKLEASNSHQGLQHRSRNPGMWAIIFRLPRTKRSKPQSSWSQNKHHSTGCGSPNTCPSPQNK